jgi:VWFA-related protein
MLNINPEVYMSRISHKTVLYGAVGALGGSAAWVFILSLSAIAKEGLLTEIMLGSIAGICIGGFLWSHETIGGRQFGMMIKRALLGAAAGLAGGAAGAALGSTIFTTLGTAVAEAGHIHATVGIALSVAVGWSMLGAAVGLSGGIMIRSRERALYGLTGGALGGLLGGLMFNELSATSIWSALAGLFLLGLCIGAFISLVEEAFVSAKVKVVKGRHIGREFPLLKELNVVGRDDRSDVCLSGAEGVGIQHAYIKRKNGHFSIEADEKGAAVYVNQKLTRESRLSDGDIVRVGSILLMFSALKKAAAVAIIILLGAGVIGEQSAVAGEPASVQITQFDMGTFPAVKVYVSLLDAAGKPMRGLTTDGLSVFENDQPMVVESVQMIGRSGNREPLCLAIVLDRSESMTGDKINRAKESVLHFISRMEPGDRAALIAFSDQVDNLQPLTGSQDLLRKAVLTIEPHGHTALFDAIARGVESVQGIPGRKAVIVLTDGIANRGARDIDQAIESAAKAFVSVSVIGLGKDVRTPRLERIAEETGGSYFFTPVANGLSEIYETISNRIRNEYVITYRTVHRGDYLRNVAIALHTGQRTMRPYFQPESSLFGAGRSPSGWAFAVPFMSVAGLIAISLRKVDRLYQTGHLSLVRGRGTTNDIDINSTVTIGRDERNDLGLFKDSSIEQQHAAVIKENGRYLIEDKGSESGTFVNKKKVKGKQALDDGDVINIGKTTIVFSEGTGRTCTGCGAFLRANAKFCAKCGMTTA